MWTRPKLIREFNINYIFIFNVDARNPLEIFKLKKRITLSNYNTPIDSLDLPIIDAYDPNYSTYGSPTPPNYDYSSLIAPSPSLTTPTPSPNDDPQVLNPPIYGPGPSNQISTSQPRYRPTQPAPPQTPTLRPVGDPARNPSPKGWMWCVARPTIPDPLLQRAMDYACGAGADCGPVRPNGSCFKPNTFVAHASYAFNSYWQKTKILGGTCDFGGTAMLINVDPSNDGCHFLYN
ncbi:hypothetical protein RND81_02G146300 [Saponaria officinalis]|uniref:X8 domain-containing protein n=1 Tax=Saponaria officinalis TaxID=3572 RepID=A0AAW1MT66_SAPOF